MKKKSWLVFLLLIVIASTVFGVQPEQKNFIISIRPSVLIPLWNNSTLFITSGGMKVSGNYVLPFFRYLTVRGEGEVSSCSSQVE